jgi:NADPH:quinone reductase and related Zn-dependent oxidoreductases
MRDAIGARLGRKTRHLKHDQSCKSRAGEGARIHEVVDTSLEKLGDGVRRITGGYGADIVIDGIGGEVLSEALGALALEDASQHWDIPQAARQPLT